MSFTGDFRMAMNTTHSAVLESAVVDGTTIQLDLPAGPYLRLEGTGVQLEMFGQRIGGDFVVEQATLDGAPIVRIAARNVSASFGDGTTPFVTVSGGTGFFSIVDDPDGTGPGNPKTGGLAGRLSGTVAFNVPGIDLSGTLTLAINSRSAADGAVNESIAFGPQPGTTTASAIADVNGDTRPDLVLGTATGLLLYLNDGEGDPFDTIPGILVGSADPISALAIGDLDGDGSPDLVVGRAASTTIVYLNDGTGMFEAPGTAPDLGPGATSIAIANVTGDAYGDVVLANGTDILFFQNLGLDDTGGGWLGFDAGASTGITASSTTVLALGDVDGNDIPDLVVADGNTADVFYTGTNAGTYTSGTPPGTTGSVSVVLTDVDGNGTLDLVRSTAGGIDVILVTLPDPVAMTPLTFATADQVLAGSHATFAVGDLDGDGIADLVVSSGTGAAQWLAGTDTVSVTSTFGTAVGVGIITLDLPAGPYLMVAGDDITLTVGGLELIGSFAFEQITAADGTRTVRVTVPSLSLALDGIGTVSLSGTLLLTSTGMAGTLTLGSALSFGAGITITGTFGLQINTGLTAVQLDPTTRLPAGPYTRFYGTGIELDFGGPTLTADLSVESATSGGAKRTVIAVAGGSLSFDGLGTVLSGVVGVFVLAPGGMAGSLQGTVNLTSLLPTGTIFSGTFGLQVNESTQAVTESVVLGDRTLGLNLPAGPYLRIFGRDVVVSVAGQSLRGDVSFSQQGTPGSMTTTIAFDNVSLALGDGTTDLVTLSNGHGSFVLTDAGADKVIMGDLAVTVAVHIPQVSLTGTLTLHLDTTPGAQVLSVGGTALVLTIAGQRLGGDFTFTQTTVGTRRVVTVAVAHASLFLGDDNGTATTADDRGLSVTEGSGSFLVTPEGVALDISATVGLVGLDDLPFAVGPIAVKLQVNTMPTAAVESSIALDLPAGTFLRVQIGTHATPFDFDLYGQHLTGIFFFEQVTNAGTDGVLGTTDDRKILRIAATEVHLFLGAPANGSNGAVGIDVDNGTALFLVTPDGIAGTLSAHASLLLGGSIPGCPPPSRSRSTR